MSSWTEKRLQDLGYKRYMLCGLTLDWSCTQLANYLNHGIDSLHQDLIASGHKKPVCHTAADSYKVVKKCATCKVAVGVLEGAHTKGVLGWKNSNIELWEAQPWSLSLLYMNSGQDPVKNRSPANTDISGCLNLLMFCNKFNADRTVVEEIRALRNEITHHEAGFTVTEAQYNDLLDAVEKLLTDADVAPHVTEDVTGFINKMKTMTYIISFDDEVKVLKTLLDTFHTGLTDQQEEMQITKRKLEQHVNHYKDLHDSLEKDLEILTMQMGQIQTQVIPLIQNVDSRVDVLEKQVQDLSTTQSSAILGRMINCMTAKLHKSKYMKFTTNENADHFVGLTGDSLKSDLVHSYLHRPEFQRLNPLIGDDLVGYHIDSVFEQVSVGEEENTPALGENQIERRNIKHITNPSDIISKEIGERTALVGFVGSGKSSLCSYWVRQWALHAHDPSAGHLDASNPLYMYSLVILLRAKALHTSVYHTIRDFIYGPHSHVMPEDVAALLECHPSSLILLDGYDEVNTEQIKLMDAVIKYEYLKPATIVVTSRPGFLQYNLFSKTFVNLGFNKEQQLRFINNFKDITTDPNGKNNISRFEEQFQKTKNVDEIFTAPMMAMSTCNMVACGEHVELDCRVRLYTQMIDFHIRRACAKLEGRSSEREIKEVMPALRKATYISLLEHNAYHLSREDITHDTNADQVDSILVHIGFVSVTKYTKGTHLVHAYSFVHKSFAEFLAAQHVMSLDVRKRHDTVCQLFKSGPAGLEVLRFTLGLCSIETPAYVVDLMKSIGELITGKKINIRAQKLQTKIKFSELSNPPSYYLLTLVEVDLSALPDDIIGRLCLVCQTVSAANISQFSLGDGKALTDDNVDTNSAGAVSAMLLLSGHRARRSLGTVTQLDVWCRPSSPYSLATRLPATLAACAPSLTGLTQVAVYDLASAQELSALCSGLAASGLPRLTHLILTGCGELEREAADLEPLAAVVRAATRLQVLDLRYIHCGAGLGALCAAVGEDAPSLTHLTLMWCSVPAQQYRTLLLPALHRRLTLGRRRLERVDLWRGKEDGGRQEEWDSLKRELQGCADFAHVLCV